jgi:hypothetical protein
MSFSRKPLGVSTAVAIIPDRLPHGTFAFNTTHSNLAPGLLLDFATIDAVGNTSENKYIPTSTGAEDAYSNRVRFEFKRVTSFKNNDGGYRNRVSAPDYLEWATADNVGTHFSGAGDRGVIARSLIVGTSLNSSTPYPSTAQEPPSAMATYHSTFAMKDNIVVNFPLVLGKSSGAFRADDYYTNAIEVGTSLNTNNRYVGTAHGFRTLPPNLDGQPLNNRHWTYAGALLDSAGAVGPAGNWWVYNVPFLTAGRPCQLTEATGQNGASCGGPYYGVQALRTDFDDSRWLFMSPIEVQRRDGAGNTIGFWTVPDGSSSTMLGNMRHFATTPGGSYYLTFPGRGPAKRVFMDILNVKTFADSFILGVNFDGMTNASSYISPIWIDEDKLSAFSSTDSRWQNVRVYRNGTSYADVVNSNGDIQWHDRTKNILWLKVQGGLNWGTPWDSEPNTPDTFTKILLPMRLMIFGSPITVADINDLLKREGFIDESMELTASIGSISLSWRIGDIQSADVTPSLVLQATETVKSTDAGIRYVVRLSQPTQSSMRVFLSNGEFIDIPDGGIEGQLITQSAIRTWGGDGDYIQVFVTKVTGGGFKEISIDDSSAVTRIIR